MYIKFKERKNCMKKYFKGILASVMAMSLALPITVSASSNASGSSKPENLEDKVVVYSTHPEDMLAKVADGFTKKTGVKVEFVNLKGELADRIRSEKENPQADVMYGGASSLLIAMEKEGIFEKSGPEWLKDLNPMYKSKDDMWFGTIKTPMVIFYNKDKMTGEEAPKSWSDLADPKFEGKIVSRDAGSSSQKAVITVLKDYFTQKESSEKAIEYLKALDKNTLNYYANGGMHFQAVGKGEAPVSYAVLSAIDDNINKNGMPLETVVPEEGSIVILDCIAKIKNAQHPNAAEEFINYAGSPEVQEMLANESGRIPVLDTKDMTIPEYMKASMKEMEIDWYRISETENQVIEDWINNIKDSGKDIKGN